MGLALQTDKSKGVAQTDQIVRCELHPLQKKGLWIPPLLILPISPITVQKAKAERK